MTINQLEQAEMFQLRHAGRIDQVRQRLLEGVEVMLGHYEDQGLPQELVSRAIDLAREERLEDALVFLRLGASHVSQTNDSSPYWVWIDAAGFFFDAVGTRWPYMSPDQREQYLVWAAEGSLSLLEQCDAC